MNTTGTEDRDLSLSPACRRTNGHRARSIECRNNIKVALGGALVIAATVVAPWAAGAGPLTSGGIYQYDVSFQTTTNMWGGGPVTEISGETPFFDLVDISPSLNGGGTQQITFDVPFDGQGPLNFGTYGATANMSAQFDLDAKAKATFSAGQISVAYPGQFTVDLSDLDGKNPGETATIHTGFAVGSGAQISSSTADVTVGIDTRTDLVTSGGATICVYSCNPFTLPTINDIDRVTPLVQFGVLDLVSKIETIAEGLGIDPGEPGSGAIFLTEAFAGKISSDGLKDMIILLSRDFIAQGEDAVAAFQANGVAAIEDYLKDNGITIPSIPLGDSTLDLKIVVDAASAAVGAWLNADDGATVSSLVASYLVGKLYGFRYVDFGTPLIQTTGGVGGASNASDYGVEPIVVPSNSDPGDPEYPSLLAEGAQDLLGVGWQLTELVKKLAQIPGPLQVAPFDIGNNVTLGYTLIKDLESLTLGAFQSFRFTGATPRIDLDLGTGTPLSLIAGQDLQIVVPDGPLNMTPTFRMEGHVSNQTALTLRMLIEELTALSLTIHAPVPSLTIDYLDQKTVTKTETFLREVTGFFSELACLLASLIWQNGHCYEQATRVVTEVIQVPSSITLNFPDIALDLGPAFDLADAFGGYLGTPIYLESWLLDSFNTYRAPTITLTDQVAGVAVAAPPCLALVIFSLAGLWLMRRNQSA